MSTLTVISEKPELAKIGRQIEDLYRDTRVGLLKCIALGDLVAQARKVVSTVDTTRRKASHGPQMKGDGIKAVLAEIAPNVPRSTAYRYEELSENVRAELKIGVKTPLAQIITGELKDAKSQKLLARLTDFVGGKSARQLLIGIGKPDAKIGGKREKGEELPPEEVQRQWIKAAKQTAVVTFSGLHELEERWKLLEDTQLKLAIEDAKKFAEEAEAWLKTPKPQRQELDAAKYLQAMEATS